MSELYIDLVIVRDAAFQSFCKVSSDSNWDAYQEASKDLEAAQHRLAADGTVCACKTPTTEKNQVRCSYCGGLLPAAKA